MKTANIILEELCGLIGKYTRLSREQINIHVPFLEMGADSMILIRAIREIEKVYGVKITIRTLYEEYNNLSALAKHIVKHSAQKVHCESETHTVPMQEKPVVKEISKEQKKQVHREVKEAPVKKEEKASWQTAKPEVTMRDYSLEQQQHSEALIRRYNRKTLKSKSLTQKYRPVLADSKATVGFRMSVKEMLYPIIGAKTEGDRLWDIDGNEYIDITMGFGVHMFGYRPDFIMDALKDYVDNGAQMGPRSSMIGETAQMICDFTGFERVAFANTGTEANMAALRLVRAATGKSRIAMFRHSYHGHSDYTLAEGQFEMDDGTLISVTPGIPQSVLPEVLILEYGELESLDKIMEHRHELAGVIVEPVQSRNPLLQPVEFLHKLREITLKLDIPLIFDEMITGFRCHPRGAQGLFGIQADITTYGKAIGGGLPIGVIAGKAKYLDGIDGGFWQYGDQSFPQAERTFFGGTFCQHPMVIPVANAALKYMKAQGPQLQENLNKKTDRMAKTLNTYFEENKIPIRIANFASVFRFEMIGNLDLFYYHMIERGVYIWEWRLCFLTTAHTEEDVDYIIQAAKESAEDLRRGGFLPEDTPVPRNLVYSPMEEIKFLTEEQKQLWAISQIGMNGEGASAYNVIFNLQIDGDLNYTVMKNALQKVTDRYEVLRSTIDVKRIVQKIHTTFKSELPVVDFTSYEAARQKEAVDQWILAYNKQAFDLSVKPAFAAVILKLSPQKHLLVLKAHHIFVDGISLGIILEEIAEIYSAGCEIRTPQLFESVNALAFDEQEEEKRKTNLSYWINRFSTPGPVCSLPYDYQRPKNRVQRGADKQIILEESLYRKLIALALKNNVSLYMVLFSLFTSFMQRISKSDEIIVAMPTSGRYTDESERLMGHYTSILPVSAGVDAESSFEAHLKKTAADLMEAFEYQNFSFPELCKSIKSLWPELLNVNKFPITPILFNYDKMGHIPDLSDAKTSIYMSSVVNYVDKDLFFNFIETQNRLVLDCQYSAELFTTETINRMLDSFIIYMEDGVENPQKQIKELEIITKQEKQKILENFNPAIMPYLRSKGEEKSTGRNIVTQLYEQAEKTPDNTALISNDRVITYREFNKKTNQIARMLLDHSVKRESVVGIIMEHSFEMMLGLIGILKAGSAYLPIDPGYPADRIEYMLKDCGVEVLLVQKKFEDLAGINAAKPVRTIVLDSTETLQYDDNDLVVEIDGHDLAYVIYTSGSTGKPKGVMVEHRSLYNIIEYSHAQCPTYENDTILLKGAYCFDGTALEIYSWFFEGARLAILEPGAEKDPLRILEAIEKYNVTYIFLPTSMLNAFLDVIEEQDLHALKDLKYTIVGGAALSATTVDKFHKLTNKTLLVNQYGPTESTVYATAYKLDRNKVQCKVPIGTPAANMGVYILDKSQNLVSINIAGEICLSGIGLARGYINNPELTAEKFVSNPFLCGERMYKTGDIGKWMPDGTIAYLGRKDRQVKIRGFRVEPGEIEVRILQHSAVKEAAVKVLEDTNGMKYLCAYLSAEGEIPVNELRTYLSSELPEYMIPAHFVFIETMPKTINGKIDIEKLPEPSDKISDTVVPLEAYTAPESETEQKLAGTWRDLLGHKKIGVQENFFEIGGHSINAIMMMMRLRKECNINIPLEEIFNNPSIRGLARYIESLSGHTQKDIVPAEKENVSFS
ncbi:non-ribosomal peptide synthetase [Marinisporobacter balticus]|uniref:Amino acid adenylation domain-containing protein n=1 Tax=Marinisporobacter balticus TaxID=2018667 RepID=A0A4V2SA58_9FIRM|nr:non-ribosomal peptide synthetase [Marinisporobacter balticus]TCO70410.1 amino acid adenylation domain-containing protein [Marinisporobacter balticus]